MKQHTGKFFIVITLIIAAAILAADPFAWLPAAQQKSASPAKPRGLAAVADAIQARLEKGDMVFVASKDAETRRAFSWLEHSHLIDANFREQAGQYPDARVWIILEGDREPDKGMVAALDTGYQAIDEIAFQDVRGRLYLPPGRAGKDAGVVHRQVRTDGPYRLDLATYLGGHSGHAKTKWQQARDVAADADGNLYIVGGTSAPDFPVTEGAYDTVFKRGGDQTGSFGDMDAFVTKLDARGRLLWSTYLGSPNYDRAYAVKVDSDGFVYVTGRAGPGFPTTAGTIRPEFGHDPDAPPAPTLAGYGEQDAFIAKLSPDGRELVWATYFGGGIRDMDIDSERNLHIAGTALGPNFPHITPNAHQKELRGRTDTIYVKLSADGRRVLYGTFYGGRDDSKGDGAIPSIRVNRQGEAWLVSNTRATDIETTDNAYRKHPAGGWDLLVMKFSREGKLLVGTYLGGSGNDTLETHNIAIDADDNPVIGGMTKSTDFPVTGSAFQSRPRETSSAGDGFVAKLSADGSRLLAASYIGGVQRDEVEGINVAANGDILISGGTASPDFPVTGNALQPELAGRSDFFLTRFDAGLSELRYSTFLGGTSKDQARSSTLAGNDIVLVGATMSCNFPVTNTIDSRINGAWSAMLARLRPQEGSAAPAP